MAEMDWAGLMRLGLRELGLSPAAFWALTPWELQVMSGREEAAAPMTRGRLAALADIYPDENGGHDDGQ